ncbi:MAG: hypothetical protein NC223_02390 [Butyrivibrio sp.]|nr:hypothetical protein [Butyrivibrio sp.]
MKHSEKALKTINTVLFITAGLLVCAYAVLSVVSHNYRRFEGTYVSSRTSMNIYDYGYSDPFSSSFFISDITDFERRDIVKITRREGGYGVDYIMSADGRFEEQFEDEQEGNENPTGAADDEATAWDRSEYSIAYAPSDEKTHLMTGADDYREYHGFISERAAKEGGVVECYETVTGGTEYIGIYFTQNGVCVLSDMDIGFNENGTVYEVPAEGQNFEYDGEYTLADMLSAPKKERRYWIAGGMVCICERTGLNVNAVLLAAGGASGAAGALFFAAAVIMAVLRERKRAAALGFALFGAAAAAVFAFAPIQSAAGRYYLADFADNIYIDYRDVIRAIIDSDVTVNYVEKNYEYVDIAPNGNGSCTVLFYEDGILDTVCSAKLDWRGRLSFGEDGFLRNKVRITPSSGGISIRGKDRPTETSYFYDRVNNESGFNMRLRYIFGLSFAVCVVVLLTVSGFRSRYRRAHPVISEGSYRVADILYMDGDMEYMRDYMLKNWRGAAVELKDGAFVVDGRNMGVYECEPEYEKRLGGLSKLLNLRRGVCVRPSCGGSEDEGSKPLYSMLYDRKRRVLFYGAGERTLAAFSLRPLIKDAKDCGVGV